jgi:two-component system, chemotaxis family, protein-glutamate methylesterase/glutaminase
VHRDLIVVGGSAGGIQALRQVLALLPADLQAGVVVATHLAPHAPSRLAQHLSVAGSLPTVTAIDGQSIRPRMLYTAVPDRHLLVGEHDVLRLTRGPRQNRARPAVDALFRSAARWCGPRVIGIVLSGALDDGAAGLATIVERGGTALVQRPDTARFDGMPRAALRAVPDAEALPPAELARAIVDLAGKPVAPAATAPSEALIWETDMTENARAAFRPPGRPVGLGCPDCGGGMNVVENGGTLHYLCHSGHSYSPATFVATRDEGAEAALWTALSALQEQSMVLQEMAVRADEAGDRDSHRRHDSAVRSIGDAIEVVRAQLLNGNAAEHR